MTALELRASLSLASLYAVRMLGLFLILPVFAVHAHALPGGGDALLVGLVLGIYSLTQGVLQLPFGMASDRFGRKPVIVFGLVLFALGSLVAANATDVAWTIVGRAIQGTGAISAAVTACIADLTRDSQRTKAMALVGASIGLTFALSLVAAPLLYERIGMPGLFHLTGALAVAGIAIVLFAVPSPRDAVPRLAADGTRVERTRFREVALDGELMRLNVGIFTLHMVQMAMFVVLPHALVDHGGLAAAEHWKVYLPAVLVSFAIMVPAIIAAERKDKMRPIFRGAVALLIVVQLGLLFFGASLWALAFWLLLFFVAFNILEATLPSLVSRTAPPAAKGAALGVYNTTQAVGLFIGGAAGGYIAQHFGDNAVFAACTGLALIWLAVAKTMNFPQRRQPAEAVQTV